MQEHIKRTEELIAKIRRLIEKHEKLKQSLAEAEREIESLKQQVYGKEEQLEKLGREANAMRLGQFVSLTDSEKREVRQKINDYLKEIDRIIEKISGEG